MAQNEQQYHYFWWKNGCLRMNLCILKACESFESVKIEFQMVSWVQKWYQNCKKLENSGFSWEKRHYNMVHQSLEKVEKTTDANYNNLLKTIPKPFKKLKRVKKQGFCQRVRLG